MQRTSLYDAHLALEAKIVEFAGWEMPIQYSTVLEEHRAVRDDAGIFDVSHMGDLLISGPGAERSLRSLLTNDVANLGLGRGLYAHVLDQRGKIMDDTITFRLGPETYLMVPNASTAACIHEWVRDHVEDSTVTDVTPRISCVAVQGPRAGEALRPLLAFDLGGLKRMHGRVVDIDIQPPENFEECLFLPEHLPAFEHIDGKMQGLITRSGYTGEEGYEILVENAAAAPLWQALLGSGKEVGLRPCGLGARDLLRLEMGYLLSGTDFDGTQTTLETGPEWVIKWDHEFVGREALIQQREKGLCRRLVGLEMIERGIPRHGYVVLKDDVEVGKVTSGTLSPVLGRGIALAYVGIEHASEGEELWVRIRETKARCRVVRPPFIKKKV